MSNYPQANDPTRRLKRKRRMLLIAGPFIGLMCLALIVNGLLQLLGVLPPSPLAQISVLAGAFMLTVTAFNWWTTFKLKF